MSDKSDLEYRDGITLYVFIICSIGGAILVAWASFVEASDFTLYAHYTLRVIEEPNPLQTITSLTLITGMIVSVTGLCGGITSLTENHRWKKVFLFIAFLLSAVQVAGGIVGFSMIGGIDQDIQSDTEKLDRTGLVGNLYDFSLATFDSCCMDAGLNHPDGSIGGQCQEDSAQGFQDPACVNDPVRFNYFSFSTKVEWICDKLAANTINLAGKTVNVNGRRVELNLSTNKVNVIPMVGNYTSPTFGCGGGYPKPFQYTVFVWFTQTYGTMALATIINGSIQALAVLMGVASLYLHSAGKQESASESYQRYMQTLRENKSQAGGRESGRPQTHYSSASGNSDVKALRQSQRLSTKRATSQRQSNRLSTRNENHRPTSVRAVGLPKAGASFDMEAVI